MAGVKEAKTKNETFYPWQGGECYSEFSETCHGWDAEERRWMCDGRVEGDERLTHNTSTLNVPSVQFSTLPGRLSTASSLCSPP
jgi:hypothetical protein